jgi:heme-degrading monooxygenase HmoA
MPWNVRLVDGGRTAIVHSFPSRKLAAASLRGYSKSFITRDNTNNTYVVVTSSSSRGD